MYQPRKLLSDNDVLQRFVQLSWSLISMLAHGGILRLRDQQNVSTTLVRILLAWAMDMEVSHLGAFISIPKFSFCPPPLCPGSLVIFVSLDFIKFAVHAAFWYPQPA